MRVFIDTNVILDVLTGREPHYQTSTAFLRLCGTQVSGLMAASQTTDIFYLLRKEGITPGAAKAVIQKLADNIRIVAVTPADVQGALACEMDDYEDALLAIGAERLKAQYLVTRSKKDFSKSPIPALSPQEFMERFFAV